VTDPTIVSFDEDCANIFKMDVDIGVKPISAMAAGTIAIFFNR
jgi:hypothetical protein